MNGLPSRRYSTVKDAREGRGQLEPSTAGNPRRFGTVRAPAHVSTQPRLDSRDVTQNCHPYQEDGNSAAGNAWRSNGNQSSRDLGQNAHPYQEDGNSAAGNAWRSNGNQSSRDLGQNVHPYQEGVNSAAGNAWRSNVNQSSRDLSQNTHPYQEDGNIQLRWPVKAYSGNRDLKRICQNEDLKQQNEELKREIEAANKRIDNQLIIHVAHLKKIEKTLECSVKKVYKR